MSKGNYKNAGMDYVDSLIVACIFTTYNLTARVPILEGLSQVVIQRA